MEAIDLVAKARTRLRLAREARHAAEVALQRADMEVRAALDALDDAEADRG